MDEAILSQKTPYIRAFSGPLPLLGLSLSLALRYSRHHDFPFGETGEEHIHTLLPPDTFAFQFLEVETGLKGIFGRNRTVEHFHADVYVVGEKDEVIDPLTREIVHRLTLATGDRVRIDREVLILEPDFFQSLPAMALTPLAARPS